MSLKRHSYVMGLIAHLAAAMVTGAACVLFAKIFEWAQGHRLDASRVGGWAFVIFPIGFLLSVELIRRAAPFASGTGIPQAIFAAEHMDRENEPVLFPLVSPWTMIIKIISLVIAVIAGASTGREGPTVHVAVCVFFFVLMGFRKILKVNFDPRSAIIAGAAAGLAAAFNTPLAGVTFAVEELCENYFASIKDIVLMSIIVAAVTAQILTGEYSYFGHLNDPVLLPMGGLLAVSLASGGMGLFFGWLLYRGANYFRTFNMAPVRYGLPVIMGLGVTLLSVVAGVRTLGPGNMVAHQLLNGVYEPWVNGFAPAKMATTLMTYWGGIVRRNFCALPFDGRRRRRRARPPLQLALGHLRADRHDRLFIRRHPSPHDVLRDFVRNVRTPRHAPALNARLANSIPARAPSRHRTALPITRARLHASISFSQKRSRRGLSCFVSVNRNLLGGLGHPLLKA